MPWFKNKTIDAALTVLEDLICELELNYDVVVVPPYVTYEEVYMSQGGKPLPFGCVSLEEFVRRKMEERGELPDSLTTVLNSNKQYQAWFENKKIDLAVNNLTQAIFDSGDDYSVIIFPLRSKKIYISKGGKVPEVGLIEPEEFVKRKIEEWKNELAKSLAKVIVGVWNISKSTRGVPGFALDKASEDIRQKMGRGDL